MSEGLILKNTQETSFMNTRKYDIGRRCIVWGKLNSLKEDAFFGVLKG